MVGDKKLIDASTVKYLGAGLLAFAADYFILVLSYNILKMPLVLSTTLGFMSGFAISFIANRNWVFGKGESVKTKKRQITEYTTLVIFNYAFTVYSIQVLNKYGVAPKISKLVIMSLIMCWNYMIFKYIIFPKKANKH